MQVNPTHQCCWCGISWTLTSCHQFTCSKHLSRLTRLNSIPKTQISSLVGTHSLQGALSQASSSFGTSTIPLTSRAVSTQSRNQPLPREGAVERKKSSRAKSSLTTTPQASCTLTNQLSQLLDSCLLQSKCKRDMERTSQGPIAI